ncbi:hypothetical protein EI94DRAFT_1737429 [Lactarius quietus]|nr:hypothetical protein EI94DRAFT_1737429 [Lactarius quietus]
MLRASKLSFVTTMHLVHFPLSRFQVVITVLLASVSFTSQASLKQHVPAYPTWQSGGCVNDGNPAIRALSLQVSVSQISVESCIGACSSRGYRLAGLEIQQCWCGYTLTTAGGTGTGGQIDLCNCTSPCTGDQTEFCGGTGALLLYYNSAQS